MPGVVTITGTVAAPQVVGQFIGGSGVQIPNAGGTAFDATNNQQKGLNLYDEVNQFIAALNAQVNTAQAALTPPMPPVTPHVIMDQVLLVLRTIRGTPTVTIGARVLNP